MFSALEKPQDATAPIFNREAVREITEAEMETFIGAEIEAQKGPNRDSGDMTPRTRSEDRFMSQLVESVDRQASEANGAPARSLHQSPKPRSQKLPSNSSPFIVPSDSQQIDLTLSSDGDVGVTMMSTTQIYLVGQGGCGSAI